AAEVARLQEAVAAAQRQFDTSWSLGSAAAVEAVLAELDARVAAAAEAGDAVRAARGTRDRAAAEVEASRHALAAAAEALRAARDPLVSLGAPGTTDDPLVGWAALAEWAAGARVEREAASPAAERAAATAGATADEAARAADDADAEVVARRHEATAAARAAQQARGRVEALDERTVALRTALAGAPSPEQVEADLGRRDELEASARAADAALRQARTVRAAAEEAAGEVRRELAAGWEALRGARDPLVALGAPALLGDDLALAWSALTSWARGEAAERAGRLPAAVAAVTAAGTQLDAVQARLGAALAAEGVAVGGSRADGQDGRAEPVSAGSAVAAVAASLAHAEAVRDRLAERQAEAAGKRAAQADAEERQQVARMLGGLLR